MNNDTTLELPSTTALPPPALLLPPPRPPCDRFAEDAEFILREHETLTANAADIVKRSAGSGEKLERIKAALPHGAWALGRSGTCRG